MKWVVFFASFGTALAEPQRVELLQEPVRLEAMERKTVLLFPLKQQGAQLEVKFVSRQGGEGVRLAVYAKGSAVPVAGTAYEVEKSLRVPLAGNGEYRVEIENMRQRLGHAMVELDVALRFGAQQEAARTGAARTLDPQRKRYTILSSFALFGLIVAYSAARLGPPILDRWRGRR